jgi:GGDEF domain-containing protein
VSEARDVWATVKEATGAERLALLSADTDRTQDYVFESSRLPEIRGGSLLLTELNEGQARVGGDRPANIRDVFQSLGVPDGHIDDDPPGCIIYAGGGSLLALVPLDEAKQLADEIERLYPRETDVATITCTWQEVQKPDMDRFDQLMKVQDLALKRAKGLKVARPFLETLPFAQRCRSCGQRSVTTTLPIGGTDHVICAPCLRKYEYGTGENRRYWLEDKEKGFDAFLEEAGQKAAFYAPCEEKSLDPVPPNDLNDIGAAAKGKKSGYIGFIYADGDEVGEYIQSWPTAGEYRQASNRLETVTRNSVFQALADTLTTRVITRQAAETGEEETVCLVPFEIITIGGDDVLLIVPADAALKVAARMSQYFSEAMAEESEKAGYKLTLSAGLVLAQYHTPVQTLRDLATQLLKHGAKARRRKTKKAGQTEAGVDFLVLKSQAMLGSDVGELRREPPYFIEEAGSNLLLTHCPYTLSEAHDLLADLDALQRTAFPTSQLHLLAGTLQKGRQQATLFYQYQIARLQKVDEDQAEILVDLGTRWSPNPSTDPIPWTRSHVRGVHYQTALLDLAELYDFVPWTDSGGREEAV